MTGAPNGGSAFPMALAISPEGDIHQGWEGMTLRDYFAAKEPIGEDTVTPELATNLMGTPTPTGGIVERAKWWAEAEARYKYLRADAMLKVRAEP